jgi:glycosyltransferase involved in cell wall biosynthesis
MQKLCIGVDATCWSNRRGYGRFARDLLTAAVSLDQQNRYVFFVDHEPEEFCLPGGVEVFRIASRVPVVKAAAANGRRSLRDLWAVSRAISQQNPDLVFFPSVYSYVPVGGRVPTVVTIHDAIPELYPHLVFPTWRSKFFWRAKVKLACVQARLIATVSEYSRRCLTERLKIPLSRLRVINEASSPVFHRLERPDAGRILNRWGLSPETRFLAYVGGFSPHKNLSLLLDVFRELRSQPRFADLRLLLVGDYEGDVFYSCYRKLVGQVQRWGLQDRVLFTGHLGDEDLVLLLNLAGALVLPSFCEGFGLPAVEAAACGTPVVATTRSPLPELLGEGAITVEPEDRVGWLRGLERVLSDVELRKRMRAAGQEAASRLSWENSARQLLAIFEEAVRSHAAAA